MLWKEHNNRKELNGRNALQVTQNEVKTRSRITSRTPHKIGIPYIFYFHDYLPFWTTLLREMGFEVEVSPKTNREIVNRGTETILAETCFPVKVAHGHVLYLIDKGVDALFIPSFINMNTADEEFERGYACPLTQTIPYAAKVANAGARIIAPIIDLKAGQNFLLKELHRALGQFFPVKKSRISVAIKAAEEAQESFSKAIRDKASRTLSALKGKNIVIIGRSYNALDSGMNLDLPRKLSNMGVTAIPMDFIPSATFRIEDKWPNMYWRSGQKILKTARYIVDNPALYAIYIGNFSCGPDSFISKYLAEEMKGKPFLQLEIDEHSADAGVITRCEAFLDSIENHNTECLISDSGHMTPGISHRVSVSGHHSSRTVFVPRMADHAFAIAAAFERCGVDAEVLPETDREAVDIGRRNVSGKECYPCTVTTGDMLRKAFSSDFRPDSSAFFMPSGTGPCRFGQYNVFHRMVLDSHGFHDVPIFSPNQDSAFYRELGTVGKNFAGLAWNGIVVYTLLNKCLHETRPYEKDKGAADDLYNSYHTRIYNSLRGADGNIGDVLRNMRRDFENLPRRVEKKPVIGIVGEIFVRSHRFSNEDLIRKIEALGGEARLVPVEEWIYYINLTGLRKALIKKDRSAIIELLLKKFFQKTVEHRHAGHFKGLLRTLKEPGTREILRKASPYIHDSFEGEAILSIGKSIDLIEKGVSGIINAMPFGCMPGTVVATLMRGISRDYRIPCLSIPFDGTESPTTEIQLEAFMDQAFEYSNK